MNISAIVLGIILILSASYISGRLLEGKKYYMLYLITFVPLTTIVLYYSVRFIKGEEFIATLLKLSDQYHMILFSVIYVITSMIGNALLPDNKPINIIEIEDHLVD